VPSRSSPDLGSDGVVKVDDRTVAFHLEAPDAAFVDAVSCDNYTMIIVPNGYNYSDYQKQWVGTGHFHDVQLHPERRGDIRPQPALLGDTARPSECSGPSTRVRRR